MITVSQKNSSIYRTINEALEVCVKGDTIAVEPGVYKEAIHIDKDIKLLGIGESGQVVIEHSDQTCVFVKANRVEISNIAIRGTGIQNKSALLVERGESIISDCIFSSYGTGVKVRNEGTSASFAKCLFHESHSGIETTAGSLIQLTECSIVGNRNVGLRVGRKSNFFIKNTVIKDNDIGGLFEEEGQGKVEYCEVTANRKGIVITNHAAPIFEESMFTRNEDHFTLNKQAIGIIYRCFVTGGATGISAHNKSHVNIIETTIENNEKYNTSVESSTINLTDCILTRSEIGLFLRNLINSTIDFSTISNHTNAGIILENRNELIVQNCKVDSAECGVCFQNQATGEIQDSEITSSILTGIAIIDRSSPKITNCHVVDGQGIGLYIKDGSGIIENSRILNHSHLNLFQEENHSVVIENCLFEEEEVESIPAERLTVGKRENLKHKRNEETLDTILAELHTYVGLDEVKERISDLMDFISYTIERKKVGIHTNEAMRHHCIFLGNPGTGKTTVARLMSKIFFQLGVTEKDVFVEVDRKDLVGEYVGKTALKTNKIMKSAKGGVLFIDEAYTLIKPETKNDFGQEALDLILKKMEDDNSFIVIAAGYPEEMQSFLEANPGLKDRFTNYFCFEDYSPSQLISILEKMLQEEEYSISEETKQVVQQRFTDLFRKRDRTFSNARMVRKFFEELKMIHAKRCIKLNEIERTKEALSMITGEDVELLLNKEKEHESIPIPVNEERLEELIGELHSLIGLEKVKQEVEQIVKLVKYYKEEGKDYTGKFTPHTVFLGNPGTGKTTVARLLSQIYEALGILPVGDLIETSREDLVAGYVGQTALKTTDMLNKAKGSTLFVDEAHTLSKQNSLNDFGQEAIDTILRRMEDERGKFHLIAAGYTNEMQTFLKSNPGLASRFGNVISFEDYSPSEMVRIAEKIMADEDFEMEKEARESLLSYFERCYENRDRYFSNARFVRTVVELAIRQATLRIADIPKENREGQYTILMEDFYQFI